MITQKNKCFIWISDCHSNTGEGRLGINFIKKLSLLKKINFEIKTPNFFFKNINNFINKVKYFNFKKSNFSRLFRYTIFLKGIIYLWINFFKGKRVLYLNYLPLWNFMIFLLAPPKTIFGPITGSKIFLIKRKFV